MKHFIRCAGTLVAASGVAIAGMLVAPFAVADEQEDLIKVIKQLTGSRAAIGEVKMSPMGGTYQLDLGGRTMYATYDGKHLLLGDVFDIERGISLAEEIKQQKAKEVIDAMPEEEMIVYVGDKPERSITVYTDVDCGYCQKLHQEVPKLTEGGVKVRYIWYPRSGPNTPSFKKAESVWCADDQLAAMDDAKLKRKFTDKSCENPVLAQYESGQKVGVRGTPTIVVDDGTIIGGYVPYNRLLAQLGLGKSNQAAKQ